MKKNILLFFFLFGTIVSQASTLPKIKILTTFSVLKDFAQQVGKDRVIVDTLVPPNGDPHVYEPKPSDVKKITSADLIFMNGLGFEGWMERLISAAQYKESSIICTAYIHPRLVLEDTVVKDPHAWHSVSNAKIYIRNIANALIKIDPQNASYYEKNTQTYLQDLTSLDEHIRRSVDKIDLEKRKIITAHDAFGYFGNSYGIQFLSPQGVSTESEPSIRSVISLIEQIKKLGIKTIFIENISNPKIIHQISRETNAKIGGTLYSDGLSESGGVASTYIKMIRHNFNLLLTAMKE
ncbi:metal ABC transporter substrate-binding protein [Alphaproteobacteria bacterium]|nr:metal ABC transporter substrate-binding protein [Alphaproteobacteria bacterium]